MKRKFLVSKLPNGDQIYGMSGPFVVVARNPLHAARLARHNWPSYLSNHVREETHALAVRSYGDQTSPAFVSDRRGKVIPRCAAGHF